jgi:hypothetical protein
MDLCRTTAPHALPISADHTASCWLYQEKRE